MVNFEMFSLIVQMRVHHHLEKQETIVESHDQKNGEYLVYNAQDHLENDPLLFPDCEKIEIYLSDHQEFVVFLYLFNDIYIYFIIRSCGHK